MIGNCILLEILGNDLILADCQFESNSWIFQITNCLQSVLFNIFSVSKLCSPTHDVIAKCYIWSNTFERRSSDKCPNYSNLYYIRTDVLLLQFRAKQCTPSSTLVWHLGSTFALWKLM